MQAVRKLTSVNRLLADLAGLAVIGRLIKPLMTDHLKCRPLTIVLSDCRVVPSYCEGICPGASDGRGQVSPTRASRIAAVVTP
jgi:hypothetical protein